MQSSTSGYLLWSSSIVARLVGLRRSLVRVEFLLGKSAPDSRHLTPLFAHLPPTSEPPKPLHFLRFPCLVLFLPQGPNGSQGVPRGRTTCLFDTQLPWLAPRNSRACSSNPTRRPTVTTRSAALISTNPCPPMKSPSDSIFMGTPFERSSATSLATPTSTPSSQPLGPAQDFSETRGDPRAGLRAPPSRGDLGRYPRRAPTRGLRRQ